MLACNTNSKIVNWSRKHQLLFESGGRTANLIFLGLWKCCCRVGQRFGKLRNSSPVTTNSKLVNWSRKHQLLFELGGEWLTWSFSGCRSVVVGWSKGSVNCRTSLPATQIPNWWIDRGNINFYSNRGGQCDLIFLGLRRCRRWVGQSSVIVETSLPVQS